MSHILLSELPPPPSGKTGWPWSEASPPLPETMPDGFPWPRISIVTTSYNQAEYLEETVRSILLQSYPNLEYIIIDGGSTDGSLEIIRKYEPWLAYWVSEPDRGQSHAINKGFEQASGEVFAFLNSDDIYYPDALRYAAVHLSESRCDILIGSVDVVQVQQGQVIFIQHVSPNQGDSIPLFPIFINKRVTNFGLIQTSMFFRRATWQQTGVMNERYHYVMDRDWFTRALAIGANVSTLEATLSRFSYHPGSKSQEHAVGVHLVRAQIFWRLSRSPGFRRIPCLLEGLRWGLYYLRELNYTRYKLLSDQNQRALAFVALSMARLARIAYLGVDRLGRFQMSRHRRVHGNVSQQSR